MSLTLSDVKRIANLAQLDMDDAHAEIALGELNGIFALAEQMQAVDTTGVAPLAQPLAAILGTCRCACATTWSPKRTAATTTRRRPRKPRTACTWCQRSSSNPDC